MALKKRAKVSAEFSMSSLTDIIFLLLIFFMLTSGLVAPNSLNLKLPGSSNARITASSKIDNVSISENGRFYFNGKNIDLVQLESQLSRRAALSREQISITIAPDSGTPTEHVVAIMSIAIRHNINGILATEQD